MKCFNQIFATIALEAADAGAFGIFPLGLGPLRRGSSPAPGSVPQRRTLPLLPSAARLLSTAARSRFQRFLLQSPNPQLLPLPALVPIFLASRPVRSQEN